MTELLNPEYWIKRIEGYLDGGGNTDALFHFLKPRIEREPFDVMSGDEIRERLWLIRVLQSRLAVFEPSNNVAEPAMDMKELHVIFFLQMPLSKLKGLGDSEDLFPLYLHLGFLKNNIELCKFFFFFCVGVVFFLITTTTREYLFLSLSPALSNMLILLNRVSSLNTDIWCSTVFGRGRQPSDEISEKLCIGLHGRQCALSGAEIFIKACSIVPSSMFKTAAGKMKLQQAALEFFNYLFDISPMQRLIFTQVLEDQSWNLIPLFGYAEASWTAGCCGFECLGIYPEDEKWAVKLKFHWLMPRYPEGGLDARIQLNETTLAALVAERFEKVSESGFSIEHFGDDVEGATLLTGTIIRLWMSTEADAARMQLMFNMQWAVARIAAMSGYCPDEDTRHRILQQLSTLH